MVAGSAVSGQDWTRLGRLNNWLRGRGRQLIPTMTPSHGTLTGGSAYDYEFRVVPSYQNFDRVWVIALRTEEVDVTAGSATLVTQIGSPDFNADTPGVAAVSMTMIERLASQSSTIGTTTLVLDPANSMDVDSIGMWELPRYEIATSTNERGVDTTELRVGQPIKRESKDNLFSTALDTTVGKRVLVNWAVPHAVGGATSTTYATSTVSSTFGGLWPDAIPALARIRYRGDTSKTVTGDLYAWVTGGGSAEMRIVSDVHGNGGTVSISNTTPAWTSSSTVSIDTEDLGVADGRRSGAWDGINFDIRAISGTLYVASACAYETT